MQLQWNALGWNENAVAFKERQHYVVPIKHAAAIHTQKCMKTVLFRLKVCQLPVLRVQEHPFYLEISAPRQ